MIHARTKAHGYRPPAYWDRIADIRQHVRIPIVANGEIWTVEDAIRCRDASGCDAIMLGRGIVANPGLALAIKAHEQPIAWEDIIPLLNQFWALICTFGFAKYRPGRIKQWLNYLRKTYPQAEEAYMTVRTMNDSRVVEAWLRDLTAQHTPPRTIRASEQTPAAA